jgi:hypothetical protein
MEMTMTAKKKYFIAITNGNGFGVAETERKALEIALGYSSRSVTTESMVWPCVKKAYADHNGDAIGVTSQSYSVYERKAPNGGWKLKVPA